MLCSIRGNRIFIEAPQPGGLTLEQAEQVLLEIPQLLKIGRMSEKERIEHTISELEPTNPLHGFLKDTLRGVYEPAPEPTGYRQIHENPTCSNKR